MKNDVEIAKQSWNNALKHYLFIQKETGYDYNVICDIIRSIQSQRLDEILYATTSHEMLIISKKHRYDARTNKVRIELDNKVLRVEYFPIEKGNENSDVTFYEINQYDKIIKECIKKLIDK
jgi:hypothetical protein